MNDVFWQARFVDGGAKALAQKFGADRLCDLSCGYMRNIVTYFL